jgi:hypothetical protein
MRSREKKDRDFPHCREQFEMACRTSALKTTDFLGVRLETECVRANRTASIPSSNSGASANRAARQCTVSIRQIWQREHNHPVNPINPLLDRNNHFFFVPEKKWMSLN